MPPTVGNQQQQRCQQQQETPVAEETSTAVGKAAIAETLATEVGCPRNEQK
jgi:hypothetical protein